jgi:hypothetical protein
MLTLPYKLLRATLGIATTITAATTAPDPRLAPVYGDDIDELVNRQLARLDRR